MVIYASPPPKDIHADKIPLPEKHMISWFTNQTGTTKTAANTTHVPTSFAIIPQFFSLFPSGICYITENAITSKYSHHNINHRMPSGQIKRKHLYMCQQITANNAGKNYQIPFLL